MRNVTSPIPNPYNLYPKLMLLTRLRLSRTTFAASVHVSSPLNTALLTATAWRQENGKIRPLTESKPLSRLPEKNIVSDQVGEEPHCAKFGVYPSTGVFMGDMPRFQL